MRKMMKRLSLTLRFREILISGLETVTTSLLLGAEVMGMEKGSTFSVHLESFHSHMLPEQLNFF